MHAAVWFSEVRMLVYVFVIFVKTFIGQTLSWLGKMSNIPAFSLLLCKDGGMEDTD